MRPNEIRERLIRLLGAEGLEAADVDLKALENEGGELPEWLASLVAAAETLPLPEVPAVVSQDLRHMFDHQILVEPHTAVLVRDTRVDKQLVGARGADVAEGWSLTYTSPVADLVLDIWPRADSSIDLAGHVMAHGQVGNAFRVKFNGPTEAAIDSDGLGRFRVEAIPSGRYGVEVGNRLINLTLDADLRKD